LFSATDFSKLAFANQKTIKIGNMSYDPQVSEQKWQEWWEQEQIYKADLSNEQKPRYYNLTMFPYPSGDKLHVGHWYNYAPCDSWGRFMRMRGHNVFQPMGFDSFGLPAENYAIKTGVPPRTSTMANIETMREQLKAMGAMWNFDQEVITSEPEYYRWSQWLFLQLYKQGLAEKRKAPVNWCPSCQTVLANEQVDDGVCERCKSTVTKKDLVQWFFRITDYAEKLLDYSEVDWPEKTITMQQNWIGRSEGAEIDFEILGSEHKLRVYTTRPDTLFGATFVVLAPEHPLINELTTEVYRDEVQQYIEATKLVTDIERTNQERPKTGVFIGAYAINPATKAKIPVYTADFVLTHYGTGAIMATPGHDERDHQFAQKFGLPIKQVVSSAANLELDVNTAPFTDYGYAINSEFLNGLDTKTAISKMINWLAEQNLGEGKVNFRLRDWLISRQRYWGAPIPIVYDPSGNPVAVPEEHLPWLLPTDVEFKPTGVSPLAQSAELKARVEKIFGPGYTPEIDTMDTFVCSSWYYFRYLACHNQDQALDNKLNQDWLPVDMYIGGPEHACMHLLYARFINKVMYDMGHTPHKEPFKKLVHQGLITKDGAKMSKSKGNVVSPDEFIKEYGSDVFRMYLMFLGPFKDGGDWNDKGISGIARFMSRLDKALSQTPVVEKHEEVDRLTHKTIKKVTQDLLNMQFNTGIAALMEYTNFVTKVNAITPFAKEAIVRLIAPLAPHFAEEMWHSLLGNQSSVFDSTWPEYDESLTIEQNVKIVVQINGKLRGEFEAMLGIGQAEALEMAKNLPAIAAQLSGKELIKEIYVPNKLVSLVVK